jgi:hypothetical protein
MTKERPILFSGAMVRAILDGRKTQTRRIIKLPPAPETLGTWELTTIGGGTSTFADGTPAPEMAAIWHTRTGTTLTCRHGQPGDRLWVRETWQHSNHPLGPYDPDCMVFYRADYQDDPHGPDGELSPEGKYRDWRPSIHMPRTACRMVLEVTGVRVERLQNCSEADAIAEGTPGGHGAIPGYPYAATPGEHYRWLWDSINGASAWETNPWVWVVEFRRVQR